MHQTEAQLIIDDDVPSDADSSTLEPLYASVHKSRIIKHEPIQDQYEEIPTFQPDLVVKDSNANVKDGILEEGNTYERNELGFAFNFLNSEEEAAKPPLVKKNSYDTDDEGSVVSVSSLENGSIQSPSYSNKPIRKVQSDNRRQQSNVVNLDLPNEGESQIQNFQNFQPKYLAKTIKEEPIPNVLIENPSPRIRTEGIILEPSLFDNDSSLVRRYSNFSVNDIIRQDFLPTTRLDYNPFNASNDSDNRNNSIDEHKTPRNLEAGLSKLHIQNQYQSERNRSPHCETPIKLEEPKTYGKPVMTKSPRTDFLPTNSTNNTIKRDKVNRIPDARTSETEQLRHFIPKLKKTKNSDLLLGNHGNTTHSKDVTNSLSTNKISTVKENTLFSRGNNFFLDNDLKNRSSILEPKNEITFKLGNELRATYNSSAEESDEATNDFQINSIQSKIEAFSNSRSIIPIKKSHSDSKNIDQKFGRKKFSKPQVDTTILLVIS